MLLFLSPKFKQIKVAASCVNTDFSLDKNAQESRHTWEWRHLLQNKFALAWARKTRNMYRFCCEK